MQTLCPFTYAALRALALCNCAEAANPTALPPLTAWLPARAETARPAIPESELRQAITARLDCQADDHVLEIGFGAGDSLGWLVSQTPRGYVIGVERSLALVTQAAKRHQFSIKAGRLELEQAEPDALPFEFARFNKIVVAYDYLTWETPEYCLNELRRVLQPGGQLAIGLPIKPRWRRAQGLTLEEAQEVAGLVRWVGFLEVKLNQSQGWACITATR